MQTIDRGTAQETLAVDVVPWPRAAESGQVAVQHIQAIGLCPEDCFGILPRERNARELLFVYRDRDRYAQARRAVGDRPPAAVGVGSRWWPGLNIATESTPISTRDRADAMQFVSAQLAAAGITGVDLGPGALTPPVAAGAPAALPVFVHGLQWPGTRRVPGFKDAAGALTYYSEVVGLRPEDTFGFLPGRWNTSTDIDHWGSFYLLYADRPEYEAGRARLAALPGRHDTGDSAGYREPLRPASPSRQGRRSCA